MWNGVMNIKVFITSTSLLANGIIWSVFKQRDVEGIDFGNIYSLEMTKAEQGLCG